MKKKKQPALEQHVTEALLAIYSAQLKLESSGSHAEADHLDRVVHLIKRLLEQLSSR